MQVETFSASLRAPCAAAATPFSGRACSLAGLGVNLDCMTFRGSGRIGGSNVSAGVGGGIAAGGVGVVGVIIAIVYSLMGGGDGSNPLGGLAGGSMSANDPALQEKIENCTWEEANRDTVCRIVGTTVSLDTVWPTLISNYREPKTVIFNGTVQTACGTGTSGMGPFYCPADETAYFDPSFFDTMLTKQLRGSDGPLAQMYVVAHEYGHHVQQIKGDLKRGQQGGNAGSVKVELQADCYAGVWADHADDGPDALLEPITQDQIRDVITTAQAIGDDSIQGSNSNKEGWTHGSAADRTKWFMIGYQSGRPDSCNTFAPGAVR